jgi:CBS domain containing-hemolysin-like protein
LSGDIFVDVFILAVLLVLSATFSAVETAFYSVDRFKVAKLLKKNRAGATSLQALKKKQTRFLVTILLLNNVVNIAAASFATIIVLGIFPGNEAVAIATLLITFLVLVFGEITPKALASKHAVKLMLVISTPMLVLIFILSPITIVLEKFTLLVVGSHKKESLTEDEVRMIVSLGVEDGAIDKDEHELIHRVFTLDDTSVESIMTPKVEVVMVEKDDELSSLKSFLKKNPYSKIPVYDKKNDVVVGIFNVRVALNYLGKKLDSKIGSLMEKPLFVSSSKKIDSLLKEFQQKKIHIAIVVDKKGIFLGVVTLEDILEELVGEITEDKDDEYPVKLINSSTIIVDGRVELSTVNEKLRTKLESEKYNTVAGLIIGNLGHLPSVGQKIKIGKVTFRVLEFKNSRIGKVKITIK